VDEQLANTNIGDYTMRRFATLFQEYLFLNTLRSLRGKTEEKFTNPD